MRRRLWIYYGLCAIQEKKKKSKKKQIRTGNLSGKIHSRLFGSVKMTLLTVHYKYLLFQISSLKDHLERIIERTEIE